MKAPLGLIAAALLGVAFAAGWLLTPALPAPDDKAPRVRHQGETIGANLRRLSTLDLVIPPPPIIVAEAGAQGPDIVTLFRRDLRAVVRAPLGPVVWVADPAGRLNRRVLRIGDTYRDGWRIASIDAGAVNLRRGGEQRRIGIVEVAPDILQSADRPRPSAAGTPASEAP